VGGLRPPSLERRFEFFGRAIGYDCRMVMRPTGDPVPPWALEPKAGWLYLGLPLALIFFLALLPVSDSTFDGLSLLVAVPTWVAGLIATWLTYSDRKAMSLPAFWWPLGVFGFGPFGYIFYVYARRKALRDTASHPSGEPATTHSSAGAAEALGPAPDDSGGPPGWYFSAERQDRQRYWDGSQWTEYWSDHDESSPPGYYPAPDGSPSWSYWDGARWKARTDHDDRSQRSKEISGGERAAPPRLGAELEQLAELHRRGSLSDVEFAQAKQKLIGGSGHN